MDNVTIQRKTINTNEYLKSLPRKKKKQYKNMLKRAYTLKWEEEPIQDKYVMYYQYP